MFRCERTRGRRERALLPAVLVMATWAVTGGVADGTPTRAVAGSAGAWRFVSDRALHPVRLHVLVHAAAAAPGYIFVSPIGNVVARGAFHGQKGPLILDGSGNPVWQRSMPPGEVAMGFRAQTYRGRPVLTWWQGNLQPNGIGHGVGVIVGSDYRTVAVIRPARGLRLDPHELQITPRGTVLFIVVRRVRGDLSAYGGQRRGTVLDPVVQEESIRSRRVVWRWDVLRHLSLRESYTRPSGDAPWDAYHLNAIDVNPAGDLLVSSRNTATVYALSRRTGGILWRLGGKRSSFRPDSGVRFAGQHDARFGPGDTITLFDNEAVTAITGNQSRGLVIALDKVHRRAHLVRAYEHPNPPLRAGSQGNLQPLPNGDVLVGWGAVGYISEFDARGRLVFDARFPGQDESYRALRLPWTGHPTQRPRVAARLRGRTTEVFASWNGATDVTGWRVLCGSRPGALKPTTAAPRTSFETVIAVRRCGRFLAVRALGTGGTVLRTSRTIARQPARRGARRAA